MSVPRVRVESSSLTYDHDDTERNRDDNGIDEEKGNHIHY